MAKTKGSKAKGSKSAAAVRKASEVASPEASGSRPKPTAEALVEKAQILLAQHNTPLAIQFLNRALHTEADNLEALELAGVAECEEGDVEVGRRHLLRLVELRPPSTIPTPHPSPYLYLAQTATTSQEALMYYESAVTLFESLLAGDTDAETTPGDIQEMKRDCVQALIAMIEIWMSDLCFEPQAAERCNTLVERALAVLPSDADVQLTLASIRLSESRPDDARTIIFSIHSDIIAAVASGDLDAVPPIPTRHTLTRLLCEFGLYEEALGVVDSVRTEDEMDVEGAYLEGWCWYLRGEALEAEDNASKAAAQRAASQADDADGPLTKDDCWTEALGSLLECKSLHEQLEYPDEGILAHAVELVDKLTAAGITVPVQDEQDEGMDDEAADEEGDVEMA